MREAARALSVQPTVRNRRPPSTTDEISGRWLELQYGWLPLVGDIQAAAEAVGNLVERPTQRTFRVSRSVRKSERVQWGNYLYVKNTYVHKRYMKVTIFAAPNPFTLNLVDVATVAWEKTSYSFVADWFLPIGDYLGAMKVLSVLPVSQVATTDVLQNYRVPDGYTFNDINGGYIPLGGDELMYRHEYDISRSVSTSLPSVPLPSLVSLDEALSWRRAANAVSLAYQRFKS